jgi:hypothetical protein
LLHSLTKTCSSLLTALTVPQLVVNALLLHSLTKTCSSLLTALAELTVPQLVVNALLLHSLTKTCYSLPWNGFTVICVVNDHTLGFMV